VHRALRPFQRKTGTIALAKKSNGRGGKSTPKPRRGATIVDVARVAGVSKSTVSLVLQESPLIKPDTKEAVRRSISQLGYVYNRSAARLRKSGSDFIGVVIGDQTNPFFAELAAGIEDVLVQNRYLPVIANAHEDAQHQVNVIRTLREHGVAGIILSPARGTTGWILAEAVPKSLPAVIAMCPVDDCPIPYVGPDNIGGAYAATKHLIDLGHRSIAFLGGDSSYSTQRERLKGWRKALEEDGLPADSRFVIEAPPTRAGGVDAMSIALDSPARLTAAFCHNDVVALGASKELARRGLMAGRDFSLIGFDDIPEAAHSSPSLTTISVETRAMGRLAATRLMSLMAQEKSVPRSYLGDAQLILRSSTSPLMTERNSR
jgi:LacI family transcriptional regulator